MRILEMFRGFQQSSDPLTFGTGDVIEGDDIVVDVGTPVGKVSPPADTL
jgi:hypothetical protein